MGIVVRPYSEDIRTRVIQAYLNCEGSQRQIASRFNVSLGFVRNLLKRYRHTGSFEPKDHSGPTSKIDPESLQLILRLFDDNPSIPLSSLCNRLVQERQLRISRSTMWRTVKKYRPRKARSSFRKSHSTSQVLTGPRLLPNLISQESSSLSSACHIQMKHGLPV